MKSNQRVQSYLAMALTASLAFAVGLGTAVTQASPLTIDGINLGQTSCEAAIKTVLVNYRQTHARASLSSAERDRQIRLMRTLLKKSPQDRASLDQLYDEYAAQTEKRELERLSKWSPSIDTKGFTCTLPGFAELGTSFATAFNLIQPGSMSLENMKIKRCPYKLFYSASGISNDASQSPLACFEGKASFYSRQVRETYSKLKKDLNQNYGTPEELPAKLSLTTLYSINQNIQLNTLYKSGGNYILLVNLAENVSGKPALDASDVAVKDLRPANVSEVYYFTQKLYDANKENKMTYLDLEKKQLELVQRKNVALDEKDVRAK